MNFSNWYFFEEQKKSYSCVLANIEPAQEILSWTKKHIAESDVTAKGYENEPHVTALYGLHTDTPEPVAKLVVDYKPFEVGLGKISKFDTNPEFDVIKIEVKGTDLFRLNGLLKTLKYTTDYPKYSPHCTLAYVKKGHCHNLIGDDYFVGKKFRINKLIFSNSEKQKTEIRLK